MSPFSRLSIRPHAIRPHAIVALLLAMVCAACATVPAGPPPDVVRLQNDIDRLHSDPRIATNGGNELANADAAVSTLAHNARTLDARAYQQGVYIADRLVRIAEASALARYAEQRGTELGLERERLVARASTGALPPGSRVVAGPRTTVAPATTDLIAVQSQLSGLESRVDARGLVVRIGDFMFERDSAVLTASAQQSLDSLARVLRAQPAAQTWIEPVAATYGSLATARAATVRSYLGDHGVDPARLDIRATRTTETNVAEAGRGRVDVLIANY